MFRRFLRRPGGAIGRKPNGGGEDKGSVSLAGADPKSTSTSVPLIKLSVKQFIFPELRSEGTHEVRVQS